MAETKLKIWGRFTSSNVKKVLVVADELSIAYERIDVGGQFGGNDKPEYRRLNPNGRIPTIEDDGFVLWESNSIMRYLCDTRGGEALYPREAKARASIDRWLDWQLSTVVPADVPVFMGTIRTPPEKHDKPALATAAKRLADVLRILDEHLQGKPYVTGDRRSIADVALGMFGHRYLRNPHIEQVDFPTLKAWHARLCEWPAFKKNVDLPLV
jgi:glutathione S-transferase